MSEDTDKSNRPYRTMKIPEELFLELQDHIDITRFYINPTDATRQAIRRMIAEDLNNIRIQVSLLEDG